MNAVGSIEGGSKGGRKRSTEKNRAAPGARKE